MFITAFTRALYLSISSVRQIIPPHSFSTRSILMLPSTYFLDLVVVSFPLTFLHAPLLPQFASLFFRSLFSPFCDINYYILFYYCIFLYLLTDHYHIDHTVFIITCHSLCRFWIPLRNFLLFLMYLLQRGIVFHLQRIRGCISNNSQRQITIVIFLKKQSSVSSFVWLRS
jgi:hypothetical protein